MGFLTLKYKQMDFTKKQFNRIKKYLPKNTRINILEVIGGFKTYYINEEDVKKALLKSVNDSEPYVFNIQGTKLIGILENRLNDNKDRDKI